MIFVTLSDFCNHGVSKANLEQQKWTRFDAFLQVVRPRAFLTIARPGVAFFIIILCLICDDFERFLDPWREQSNTGNDKNERVLMHFRRSVDDACSWPLQDRASYFLWSFCNEFSTILNDFCIHGVSKATPGTTKMNAIWCIFAGQATACVFDHCNNILSGCMFFRGNFAVILDAFWRHFAWFWAPVWKRDLDLWMVLGAGQNA